MNRLPVAISIPHGGTAIPAELDGRLCISPCDILHDADPFAVQLYDLGDRVSRVIKTETARTFVDLNRSLHDLPPDHPDGMIKTSTFHGRPIYLEGMEPDEGVQRRLMELYYMPYHRAIQRSMMELDLQLCLDCHTMEAIAPKISPDATGKKRPAFCLSNKDGRTSSSEMIELLASCMAESYGIDSTQISINNPFHGGHITTTYGNNPVPWIQVEMNRNLYLTEPWFDAESLFMDHTRLQDLNKQFSDALNIFFARI